MDYLYSGVSEAQISLKEMFIILFGLVSQIQSFQLVMLSTAWLISNFTIISMLELKTKMDIDLLDMMTFGFMMNFKQWLRELEFMFHFPTGFKVGLMAHSMWIHQKSQEFCQFLLHCVLKPWCSLIFLDSPQRHFINFLFSNNKQCLQLLLFILFLKSSYSHAWFKQIHTSIGINRNLTGRLVFKFETMIIMLMVKLYFTSENLS